MSVKKAGDDRARRGPWLTAAAVGSAYGLCAVLGTADLAMPWSDWGQDAVDTSSEPGPVADANDDEEADQNAGHDMTFLQWLSSRDARADDGSPASFHFDFSTTVTNAYFFRGILQEDGGGILQTSAELSFDLTDDDADVGLSAFVGMWNSVHAASDHWYEADFYAGVTATWDEWTLTGSFILYTSPADAFASIQELDLSLSYDDSDCWGGDFALNPHARVAVETGSGSATGDRRGTYLELGIRPDFEAELFGSRTIEIGVPVTVGLGFDGYYQDPRGHDARFGYVDLGLEATTELGSDGNATWSLAAGVHVLFLGDAAKDINGGDGTEVIGTVGIGFSF